MEEADQRAALLQSAAVWAAKDLAEDLGRLTREIEGDSPAQTTPVTEAGVQAWIAKVTKPDPGCLMPDAGCQSP